MEKDFENENPPNLSIIQRIRAYKLGLTRKHYRAYNINSGSNPDLYLSEFDKNAYTKSINPNPDLLNNKKRFYEYMKRKGFENYLPKLLGTIKQGEFQGQKDFKDILDKREKIVLKSYYGGGSKRVYICEKKHDKININGKYEYKDIDKFLDDNRNYIVTEFCSQADFLKNFYPQSINTIRIWTIKYRGNKYFFPFAILRMGTKKSGFFDNVSQGGLTSLIDIDTGKLSSAAQIHPNGMVDWYDIHPVTNTVIKDFKIPDWENFKEKFKDIVYECSELKYVGWDIVFTPQNGFLIIEGNNHPGLKSIQVHKPILKDEKVKNFYKNHGIPV